MLKCPRCLGLNKDQARFCRHCGVPISEKGGVSSRLHLGTILDNRYKIIDYIAKGGMGAVYKAADLNISGVWAVKEMLDYFDSEKEREYAIERFATEAHILLKLKHDCIPRFIDCFISENRYYLIMEFVEGVDLRKKMEETQSRGLRGLEENDMINWAIQLCDVLYYLHTQDPPIIYRDLKPGNIMVAKNDKVYLIDFGIARIFDPRVKGTMVGTQGYAPPEQYRGRAEPRSDLYSLAACMHHLLTGKDPRDDVPFNFPLIRTVRSELREALEKMLNKALAKDPNDRYASMAEFQKALQSLAAPVKKAKEIVRSLPVRTAPIQAVAQPVPPQAAKPYTPPAAPMPAPGQARYFDEDEDDRYERSRFSSWYMFRGDRRHTGRSYYGKKIKGKIRWSYNTSSEINSSPVIGKDGTVYFGANNGGLYALSPDGRLRWKYDTEARIRSSPCVNGMGIILVGSNDCFLHALDPYGRLLWKLRTYGRLRSSPCVDDDDIVYFGSYDHYMYAVLPNGDLKWRTDLGGYLEAAPALSDDGRIFVASKGVFSGKSYFYCLDKSGNIKSYSGLKLPVRSSPCISDNGCIYFGGMDNFLYALNPDGSLKWRFQAEGPIVSTPLVLPDGSVVFGSLDKNVYSISNAGRLQWIFSTQASIFSSPILGGSSIIFIGSDDYHVYALSDGGEVLWKTKLNGKVRTSPTMGDGEILYIGCNDGYLYAIH